MKIILSMVVMWALTVFIMLAMREKPQKFISVTEKVTNIHPYLAYRIYIIDKEVIVTDIQNTIIGSTVWSYDSIKVDAILINDIKRNQ